MKLSTVPATLAALALASVLTACGQPAEAPGTAGAAGSAVGAPVEMPADEGIPSPRMAVLGERVEVRPGVFATGTARTASVPHMGTGARIGHEPKIQVVTVTVTYENRTGTPLTGMGTMDGVGNIATLDGRSFALSFSGQSESMATVFPGRTGSVVATVEPAEGGPAYTGEAIAFTVPVPALLGEPATSLLDPPAAYYTGTPTRG